MVPSSDVLSAFTFQDPPMPLLTIVLPTDGKPGHYNLAEGICAAISRRRPVSIVRVPVARPRWLPGRILSTMTNIGGWPSRQMPGLLGFDPASLTACDLVVSAGGDTLAANVALARRFACPNIFYGSLRRYRPADFSLVLTSYVENAQRLNHAMTLKPSAFDAGSAGASTANEPLVIGLLIGGDSGTIRYTATDWDRLLSLLTSDTDTPTRWIVANSRRTPTSISDRLDAIAKARPTITFLDVRTSGAGTLAGVFAATSALAVTVDSSSMLSEAIWAGRPTAALAPTQAALPQLEQGYRAYLACNGWLTTVPLETVTPTTLVAALKLVSPITGNPLDALADLIAQRIPALFQTTASTVGSEQRD
jgi:mitochondrial fission protein ELM1